MFQKVQRSVSAIQEDDPKRCKYLWEHAYRIKEGSRFNWALTSVGNNGPDGKILGVTSSILTDGSPKASAVVKNVKLKDPKPWTIAK